MDGMPCPSNSPADDSVSCLRDLQSLRNHIITAMEKFEPSLSNITEASLQSIGSACKTNQAGIVETRASVEGKIPPCSSASNREEDRSISPSRQSKDKRDLKDTRTFRNGPLVVSIDS